MDPLGPEIYDTAEGIASMLTSLEDFWRLIEARKEAEFSRSVESVFLVLSGNFLLANTWIYRVDQSKIIKNKVRNKLVIKFPDWVGFNEIIKSKYRNDGDCWVLPIERISLFQEDGFDSSRTTEELLFPRPNTKDLISNERWNIENYTEADLVTEEIPLKRLFSSVAMYAGKITTEVLNELNSWGNSFYWELGERFGKYGSSYWTRTEGGVQPTTCVRVCHFVHKNNRKLLLDKIIKQKSEWWIEETADFLRSINFSNVDLKFLPFDLNVLGGRVPLWAEGYSNRVKVCTDQGEFMMRVVDDRLSWRYVFDLSDRPAVYQALLKCLPGGRGIEIDYLILGDLVSSVLLQSVLALFELPKIQLELEELKKKI